MSLPTLLDPTALRMLLAQETPITDLARTLVSQNECAEDFLAELADHLTAVALANELAIVHESSHPLDAIPQLCALQLKAWHLAALDNLTTIPEPEA